MLPDPRGADVVFVHELRRWFFSDSHWAAYLAFLDAAELYNSVRAAARPTRDELAHVRKWGILAVQRCMSYLYGVPTDGEETLPPHFRPSVIAGTCTKMEERFASLPRERQLRINAALVARRLEDG